MLARLNVVVSALIVGVLVVAPASPNAAGAAVVAEPRVTLLGDSTMLRMSLADQAVVDANYDLLWDAKSCRRLVRPSCSNRRLGTPTSVLPLMKTTYRGRLGQALVLMAGYDDEGSIAADIDAIMAEATAQGMRHVWFLTYHAEVTYQLPNGLGPGAVLYRQHNVELREALGRHPTMRMIDWNTLVESHPNWVAADGIHLEAVGARGLADTIVAELNTIALGGCTSPAIGSLSTGPAAGVSSTGSTGGFVGITPTRMLDTRRVSATNETRMVGASRVVSVDVSAVAPADASAVVTTVTAVNPCAEGFLTIYPGPCSAAPPEASTVNYTAGRTTANLAVTRLTQSVICVYSNVATHVLVDVTGWFAPGGSRFRPLVPTRFVDTRTSVAPPGAIVGERSAMSHTAVRIAGVGEVEPDATAAFVNLTAVGSVGEGYLTAYPSPCGTVPEASTLNVPSGRDVAGAAIVPLGPDGSICVFASTRMHVLVDVQGRFGPTGSLYQPITPRRLVDSRRTNSLVAREQRSVALPGLAMLNVAAVSPGAKGFLSVAACGTTTGTSILNTSPGEPTANAAVAAPSADGNVCFTPSLTTHVIADISGLFVSA